MGLRGLTPLRVFAWAPGARSPLRLILELVLKAHLIFPPRAGFIVNILVPLVMIYVKLRAIRK